MTWFKSKKTREINERYEKSRKEEQRMYREWRAKKKADNDPAALAKAARLTREHNKPQVWWNR